MLLYVFDRRCTGLLFYSNLEVSAMDHSCRLVTLYAGTYQPNPAITGLFFYFIHHIKNHNVAVNILYSNPVCQ